MKKLKNLIIFFSLFLIISISVYAIFLKNKQTNFMEKSFNSYVIKEFPSAKLIVFQLHVLEKISKKEKLNLLWKLISISDLDAEILVPVVYSFYVDLNEGFKVSMSNNQIHILAPSLKSLEPAIDVSGISFIVNEAPFLYNTRKIEKAFYEQLTEYVQQQSEKLKISYQKKSSHALEQVINKWIVEIENIKNFPKENIIVNFKLDESVSP